MSTTGMIIFVIFFIFGVIGLLRGLFKKIFTTATLIACVLLSGALTIPVQAFLGERAWLPESLNTRIIAYMISCLIIYVVMRIIFGVMKITSKFPAVSVANRFGGMLIGLVEGLIVVWIFMMFMTFLRDFPIGSGALTDIRESVPLKFLYNHNLLWNLAHIKEFYL